MITIILVWGFAFLVTIFAICFIAALWMLAEPRKAAFTALAVVASWFLLGPMLP